jgi:misacylated tRNA(Ala) deacylase
MIQSFRMIKVKPTIMRVYFASGKRLMKIMAGNLDRQVQLTSLLSSTEEETVTRVAQLLEEKRVKEKDMEALNQKLCSSLAKSIASDCAQNENIAVVDLGNVTMNFMMMLSRAALDRIDDDHVLLLFLGGEEGDDSGPFLLTGSPALVDHVGKKVGEMLGGRGGGKNGRFQGKGTKLRSSLEDVEKLLMEEINIGG